MNGNDKHRYEVYLGIGSNIEPQENLPKALELLRQHIQIEAVSRVWKTPAVGGAGADFLNAALCARTALSPEELKSRVLRQIEYRLGRVRTENKYAPRTIDLDVLIVNGAVYDPQIWSQAFLAVPLAELLPDYKNPETGESLAQVSAHLAEDLRIEVCPEPRLDCF